MRKELLEDPIKAETKASKLWEIRLLCTTLTRKCLLHLSQQKYEQGEWNGQFGAWLAREQLVFKSIPQFTSPTGDLLTNFVEINWLLISYYHGLYTSPVNDTNNDLRTCLTVVNFPVLMSTYRDHLDSAITCEEMQRAISFFQSRKTPGLHGFSAKILQNICRRVVSPLLFHVTDLFKHYFPSCLYVWGSDCCRSKTMQKSAKKDLYRSIPLLNMDAKLLRIFLANCLNVVITAKVHQDQSGARRGTDINIRHAILRCWESIQLCRVEIPVDGFGQFVVQSQIYFLA